MFLVHTSSLRTKDGNIVNTLTITSARELKEKTKETYFCCYFELSLF